MSDRGVRIVMSDRGMRTGMLGTWDDNSNFSRKMRTAMSDKGVRTVMAGSGVRTVM